MFYIPQLLVDFIMLSQGDKMIFVVFLRRYLRCLWLQHGGVPARHRPRTASRLQLQRHSPAGYGRWPAQPAPEQAKTIGPQALAL